MSLLTLFILFALLQSISNPVTSIQESIYLIQPFDTKGLFKAGIFVSTYIFCILAIIASIFTRNKKIAAVLLLFIGFGYGLDILIQLIGTNDKGMSYGLFSMGMAEKSRALDIMMFKTQLMHASLFFLGFSVFIVVLRTVIFKKFRINSLISIILVVSAILLAWGSVRAVFSIVAQSYPAPIKILAIALEYSISDKNNTPRILEESVKAEKPPKMKTIVWIIDESVGGQYLSVNGFEKDTTPYLKKLNQGNPDFINFGIVPSISNCSASSNLLLRVGLTNNLQDNFESNVRSLPTIFQYAQRAGYETSFIDAQAAEGQLQNYMTTLDAKHIDDHITLSRSFYPKMRDIEVSKKLNAILSMDDDKPRFVVIVKWGSHWPYSLTYDEEIFKPAAKDSYTEFSQENKELVLNAYFNSLYHSVDGFLKTMNESNDLKNKIIFYTADHGQNLYQHDDPLTHCSLSDIPRFDEFKVPLLAFSKNIKNTINKPNLLHNTQEQLFASTLELMGYGDSLVQRYGPTLSEGTDPKTIKVNLQLTGKTFLYPTE